METDIKRMKELLGRYPWFSAARKAVALDAGKPLPPGIRLRENIRPAPVPESRKEPEAPENQPEPATKETTRQEIIKQETMANEPTAKTGIGDTSAADLTNADAQPDSDLLSAMLIIDEFIDKGERKVTAKDDTPEYIGDGNDGLPSVDDELVTEELARVYYDQGLFDQAISIYSRLSLLYPKKSIYFAEIIERANEQKNKTAAKK